MPSISNFMSLKCTVKTTGRLKNKNDQTKIAKNVDYGLRPKEINLRSIVLNKR